MDEPNPTTPAAPETTPTQPAEQPAPAAAPAESAPKKSKKGLVITIVILLITVAGGVTAALLIPMLTRIDYGPAYRQARDLTSKLTDSVFNQVDCYTVVDDIEALDYGDSSYDELVDVCKNSFIDKSLNIAVESLGETDGVKRDSKIKALYDEFNSDYQKIVEASDNIEVKLEAYRAMHKFLLDSSKTLSVTVQNSEEVYYFRVKTATESWAKTLTDSGIDTLVTYGNGWKEKVDALADANEKMLKVRADILAEDSHVARLFDYEDRDEYKTAKAEYEQKLEEYKEYVKNNQPNVKELFPIGMTDRSGLIKKFSDMKDLITTTYQEHYNKDSGDCTDIFGTVICE